MKLAVDLGASNIKVVGMINNEIQYHTIKSCATTDSTDNNLIVEFNNRTVYFGVGEPLIKQDKTEREYIEETFLLAAFLVYHQNHMEVDIGIGLPLNIYKSSKKDDYQAKMDELVGTTLKGVVNGVPIVMGIRSITILAEGYSAFIAVMPDIKVSPALIVDHGYRTTDILAIAKDFEDKWVIEDYLTIDRGLYEVYMDIAKQFVDVNKIVLTPEQIEYRIEKSPLIPVRGSKVDIREYIKFGNKVAEYIYNKIELKVSDIYTRDIYLLGGGASIMTIILKEKLGDRVVVMDKTKQMYANAVGYFLQIQ